MKKLLISLFTLSLGFVTLQTFALSVLQHVHENRYKFGFVNYKNELLKDTNPYYREPLSEEFPQEKKLNKEGKKAIYDLHKLIKISALYKKHKNCDLLPNYSLSAEEIEAIQKKIEPILDMFYEDTCRYSQYSGFMGILKIKLKLKPFPSRQECENQKTLLAKKKALLEAKAQS